MILETLKTLIYVCPVKLNVNKLCWRATCQGYTWWTTI